MFSFASRAGRWPLALTLAVLGACADEPAGPTFSGPLRPNANVADPFTVTNTNDNGIGSLRWVLSYTTGGETVRFDPSLAGQTIALDSVLTIKKSVTIEGPAGAGLTIDARGKGGIFYAYQVPSFTLRNLSLTGGDVGTSDAAAVRDPVHLVLENSSVYGNRGGGYAAIRAVKATIVNSTISGNTHVTSSTSQFPVVAAWKMEVINSTVAHNAGGGVGIMSGNGGTDSLLLRNSVISNNAERNCADVVEVFRREGANVSDDDTCGGPTEITITDPKLGALADNGGPTKTHALLVGSPAINAGSACSVQVDQRYAARDAQCDLGAFEFADFTVVTITVDPSAPINQANGWATLAGTVKCSRAETFSLAVELHQLQRAGKEETDIHSARTVPVSCSTVVQPWSASMVLTEGAFQPGTATATAMTFGAEPWVASASASRDVKLYRRK